MCVCVLYVYVYVYVCVYVSVVNCSASSYSTLLLTGAVCMCVCVCVSVVHFYCCLLVPCADPRVGYDKAKVDAAGKPLWMQVTNSPLQSGVLFTGSNGSAPSQQLLAEGEGTRV